jgi:Ca-activated chloride channel homolog
MIIFILLFSFQSFCGTTSDSGAIEANKQGIEFLKKQNYKQAQDHFSRGLSQIPFSPELQINLGLAFDGAGAKEEARKAYELAEKISPGDEQKFVAVFNQAELLGRDKKIDEALKMYQKALQFKPDSVEAKTNIELLIQQQQGGGSGQDQQKDKDKQQQKDQQQSQNDKEKDDKDKKDQDKKQYEKNKPQPRPFKSEELSQGDVKKILEELDRQEQRVRFEYSKKQVKEKTRDKDW